MDEIQTFNSISPLKDAKPAPCTICKKWARRIKGTEEIRFHYVIQEVCSRTCTSFQSYCGDAQSCWTCKYRTNDFCQYHGRLKGLNKVCDLFLKRR